MKAQMFNFSSWISECDPDRLKEKFAKLLRESGFGVLDFVDYKFSPYGYTALWLLSESHFAIHTFPEEEKTYIELSSCIERQYEVFKKLFNIDYGKEV
jgi:S-adenosylmethionine decarboxylase